jgi:signal transduction histidine kinase/CheY-like chemotaxis protein
MTRSAHEIAEMTRSGLNLIKQAISIYDEDLKLTVANRRFKTMFSLPDHLLQVGAGFDETIRHLATKGEYGEVEDIEEFVSERVEQAKAFQPHYIERQRANGTTLSVEGSPLRQGGWVTVYTDISDIRRQEEMLRHQSEGLSEKLLKRSEQLSQTNRELNASIIALEEAKQELTDSEARLKSTNAMTPAHIARVNVDGIYTYTNQRLHTIIPERPKHILGMEMKEALGEEAFSHIHPHFLNALKGQASAFEFALKNSGKQVRVAFTPDQDVSGEVIGAYLLSMDITDESNARQALMHARRRELAAQLTSGLAHDFANLLTIILGQQNKLEAMSELSGDVQEIVATTKEAALRGGELLNGLGQVSATRNLMLRPVDFEELMDRTLRLIRAAVGSDIEVMFNNDVRDVDLMLDDGFTQDALLNLALNAKEAIDGAGKIWIMTSRDHADWLAISVRDNGTGFSEAAMKNAFTPFYTTKKGSVGRGLGLSTVFDYAKVNGGRVILDNHIDGGAEVTLRIPYKQATQMKPGLVLLVEDNLDIRETVRSYLQKMGHSVIEADSGEEAIALGQLPDLSFVVSDLMLGDALTGHDLAMQLRADGIAVPILIVTGLPIDNPVRARAANDFTVLPKPFTFEQLAETIQSELQ